MVSGIYLWTITSPDGRRRFYVGKSRNLLLRKTQHLYSLRLGDHCNPRMQRCFALYSEAAFQWDTLEVCTADNLTERETFWFQTYQQTYGKENVLNMLNPAATYINTKQRVVTTTSKAAHHRAKHYVFKTPEGRRYA